MMSRRVAVFAVLAAVLLLVPVGASADECPSVKGNALYRFGTDPGVGVARLNYSGERIFVPIEGVSFNVNNGFVTRVTDWQFPEGTVRLQETYELMFVGNVIKFHSTVVAIAGGTGELQWKVNSNPTVLLNTFRQIEGSLCVGA